MYDIQKEIVNNIRGILAEEPDFRLDQLLNMAWNVLSIRQVVCFHWLNLFFYWVNVSLDNFDLLVHFELFFSFAWILIIVWYEGLQCLGLASVAVVCGYISHKTHEGFVGGMRLNVFGWQWESLIWLSWKAASVFIHCFHKCFYLWFHYI